MLHWINSKLIDFWSAIDWLNDKNKSLDELEIAVQMKI